MADTRPRFITPEGLARLRSEYDELFGVERPKIVEVVSWNAPLARALIGAKVGDERIVRLPAGEKSYGVMEIRYPD
jgi:transcription elongation GreA/GreB family factor